MRAGSAHERLAPSSGVFGAARLAIENDIAAKDSRPQNQETGRQRRSLDSARYVSARRGVGSNSTGSSSTIFTVSRLTRSPGKGDILLLSRKSRMSPFSLQLLLCLGKVECPLFNLLRSDGPLYNPSCGRARAALVRRAGQWRIAAGPAPGRKPHREKVASQPRGLRS